MPSVRPCGHDMLTSLTVYRNRVCEWIQEVVASGNNRTNTTAAATTAAIAMDRQMTIAVRTPAAATTPEPPSPSRTGSEERPQPPQVRQLDAAATSSSPFSVDEEYLCAATVLSSMPEDMPLPPLAYTRRRSSSKTHTRLYRIRLPPKPRRAKR